MEAKGEDATPLSHKDRLALIAATLALALAALDVDIPAAAMPKIVSQLQGVELLGAAFTLYLFASVLGMPLFGWLSDLFGRKLVFLIGIGIFLLGSLASASATTMGFFLLSRAVQGFGAGSLAPLAYALAADLIADGGRLGKTQGIMNVVYGVSATLGPIVGWAITDHVSWRAVFWLNLPLCLLAGAMLALFFHGERSAAAQVLPGEQAQRQSVRGNRGFFGWISPTIALAYTASLLFGATILLFFAYLPSYIQGVLGGGAGGTGIILAPLSVAWAFSGIYTGVLMEKRVKAAAGWGRMMFIGVGLVAIGWLVLLVMLRERASLFMLAIVVLAVAVLGLGAGTFNTPSMILVQKSAPESKVGLATSLMEACYSIGGAIGAFAGGLVFQIQLGVRGQQDSAHLLDASTRALLSPSQANQMVAHLMASLHSVYLFACLLSVALCGVVAAFTVVYGRQGVAAAEPMAQAMEPVADAR